MSKTGLGLEQASAFSGVALTLLGSLVSALTAKNLTLSMKTRRISIYGRVSTADQRHNSQIAEVQSYCTKGVRAPPDDDAMHL